MTPIDYPDLGTIRSVEVTPPDDRKPVPGGTGATRVYTMPDGKWSAVLATVPLRIGDAKWKLWRGFAAKLAADRVARVYDPLVRSGDAKDLGGAAVYVSQPGGRQLRVKLGGLPLAVEAGDIVSFWNGDWEEQHVIADEFATAAGQTTGAVALPIVTALRKAPISEVVLKSADAHFLGRGVAEWAPLDELRRFESCVITFGEYQGG